MTFKLGEILWRQFGASIDMLINVISMCPDNYLATNKRFYYLAYHAALFLDYYLTIPPQDFSPMLSFTIQDHNRPEESIGDMIPDKIYSKRELIHYLNASRLKSRHLMERLTESDIVNMRFTEGNQKDDMDYPVLEILLYNMRHTQHHIGQLNLMIRQDLDTHMDWAFRVDELPTV
ncbi:MAG TPA: DinB family protein [Flavitalea sp.]|nr:DinB family protein [Flavitalea sp.]